MGSKRKRREEGGDPPMMETRLRRRAAFAEAEESKPQIIRFVEVPIKVKPQVDPEKESHQPEPNDDFTNPDLPDSDIDIGDVKLELEDTFTHEDEGVAGLDSNRVNDEVETPSIDSNGGIVRAVHSTSKSSSDSGAIVMVRQAAFGNDTGATGREKNSERNSNVSTNAGNPLPTEMTEQHEGTIRSDVGHVGDDTISSQHLAGGSTAKERAQKILALLETAKKDVSMILTAGNQNDEKNVENLLSTIQAKDGEIISLTEKLQAATGRNQRLKQEADSKNVRIQELYNKIKVLEDRVRDCTECKGLKKDLDEAKSEKETLQRELHAKNFDLERQTCQTILLEEEQRKLVQENSRIVEKLQRELKRNTNLYLNTISEKDKQLRSQTSEIRGLNHEIEQLDTENDHLNNSVIPKQANENKRLQEDNADLRGRIAEKDEVIQKQAGKIEELQKDFKLLEDVSKGRRADLDEARKLADENSMIKKQQKEANRKIDLLQNSILRKDNELARIKARYLRDQLGNFQLHLAAKKGDEQAVKMLIILLGADVNARNNDSETPILLAASSEGDANAILVIVKYLIEHGADLLAKDGEGQTFLHKFVSNRNPPTSSQFHDISDYLVSKNHTTLFNIRDKDNGQTPLMLAARHVKLCMATILLLETNGVDVNLFDNHGRSFLSYAAEGNKNLNLLRGLSVNGSIKYSNLTQAILFEDVDSVNVLVRLGANVNETNYDFQTPLHFAAMSRNKAFSVNTIKLLIHSGANADAKDKYGNVFLHQFVVQTFPIIPANQFHELVSFIISKDLSRLFNAPNNSGRTPFHHAVRDVEIDTATLHLLKDKGVNFNSVDTFKKSVLCYATCGNRTLRLLSDLVALGANPNQSTANDKSCMLKEALENNRLDLLKFFFNQRVDADVKI